MVFAFKPSIVLHQLSHEGKKARRLHRKTPCVNAAVNLGSASRILFPQLLLDVLIISNQSASLIFLIIAFTMVVIR